MIKYYVRTTGERALDKSFSQINYTLLIDKEHQPIKSFIKQLEIISDSDAVLLEDDIILCDDFKKHIEKVINEHPNRIINFFTYPMLYFKTDESKTFMYNQCTYYPKGIGKVVADEMKKITNIKQYDVIEYMALNKLKIKHIRYRPCLVQHIDYSSLIGNTCNNRRTIYFIDYLNELGISYEDAEKSENKAKLQALLKQKFEEKEQ